MRTTICEVIEKPWSVITFGCWQIAPSAGWGDVCSPAEADAAVKSALDSGITAFDTAEGYGDGESERRLGKALGPKKDEVVIISKIWPDAELTLASYQKQLDNSLKALGREYVDLYLVHWPGSFFTGKDENETLCEIMSALKESGKAKTIGLSNFHSEDLLRLREGIFNFSINQVPYSLLDRKYEGETRKICQNASLQYMAYSPTAQGLLAGRIDREAKSFPAREMNAFYQEPLYSHALKVLDTVESIAGETGSKPIEVALSWVLKQNNILTVIVGSRKTDQIREFSKAADLELNPDQLERLTAASDAFCQHVSST